MTFGGGDGSGGGAYGDGGGGDGGGGGGEGGSCAWQVMRGSWRGMLRTRKPKEHDELVYERSRAMSSKMLRSTCALV